MSNELLELFFTLALLQNFVLYWFLGLCPFFGVSKNVTNSFSMGLALIFVMPLSSIATWLITNYILIPFDILYVSNVVYILVIASLVQIVELFIKRTNAILFNSFGIYLPLITTNCAILGICFINLRQDHSFAQAVVASLGGASGFLLLMVIMGGIREKLEFNDSPSSFKGLPQAFLVAGILGLAFRGFF